MYEDAQEIFDYLPIRRNPQENDYINHLWQAFSTLDEGEAVARPFAVMPFHLLFMLSFQYRILRIAKHKPTEYALAFTFRHLSENGKLLCPSSVFQIAQIRERSIFDLLTIIKASSKLINFCKKTLIDNRNNKLAHAKGYIEPNVEQKIEQYLGVLKELQPCFVPINDLVADRWLDEMDYGPAAEEYIELHLAEEYICPADRQTGKLKKDIELRVSGVI